MNPITTHIYPIFQGTWSDKVIPHYWYFNKCLELNSEYYPSTYAVKSQTRSIFLELMKSTTAKMTHLGGGTYRIITDNCDVTETKIIERRTLKDISSTTTLPKPDLLAFFKQLPFHAINMELGYFVDKKIPKGNLQELLELIDNDSVQYGNLSLVNMPNTLGELCFVVFTHKDPTYYHFNYIKAVISKATLIKLLEIKYPKNTIQRTPKNGLVRRIIGIN